MRYCLFISLDIITLMMISHTNNITAPYFRQSSSRHRHHAKVSFTSLSSSPKSDVAARSRMACSAAPLRRGDSPPARRRLASATPRAPPRPPRVMRAHSLHKARGQRRRRMLREMMRQRAATFLASGYFGNIASPVMSPPSPRDRRHYFMQARSATKMPAPRAYDAALFDTICKTCDVAALYKNAVWRS